MTHALNKIVDYEIVATDGLTLFKEPICPLMNITLVPHSTTIAAGSNGVRLPQSTIHLASVANLAPAGTVTIVDGNGAENVNYTGISGETLTGCTGGTGYLSAGDLVTAYVDTTWLVFPDNIPFKATIVNKILAGIVPILASAFGNSGSIISPPETIIEPGSNGQILGGYTINTAGVSGFSPSGGSAIIGSDFIKYSGLNGNSLTLCTGGSGTLSTSETIASIPTTTVAADSDGVNLEFASALYVADTTGFPTSGNISVFIPGFGYQVVSYTGTNGYSFTGISNPNVTVHTGYSVTLQCAQLVFETPLPQSTLYVYSSANFSSFGGNFFAVNNDNQVQIINYTGISSIGTNITSLSNDMPLPQSVINVGNATSFPGSGFIIVETTSGFQVVHYTGTSGTSFTGCTGGTGYIFTGYTVSLTSFTGCTGGTGYIDLVTLYSSPNTTTVASGSNGQVLGGYIINVDSTAGFAPSGNISVETTDGTEIVAYTGTTGTEFTGCTGGIGTIYAGSSGSVLPQSIIYVESTANFPASGTLLITDSNGVESITYTGVSFENSFTGCSGGTGTLTAGDQVTIAGTTVTANSDGYVLGTGYNIVNVVSTSDFGTSGTLFNTAPYTVPSPTTFSVTGITGPIYTGSVMNTEFTLTSVTGPYSGVDISSNGQALPVTTLHVVDSPDMNTFAPSGSIQVSVGVGGGGGYTTVNYTSITYGSNPASFNGCSGGSGTVYSGNYIYQIIPLSGSMGSIPVASTAGFPEAGVLNAGGIYNASIMYTGKTATSFTGCVGSSYAGFNSIAVGDYLSQWYGGGFDYTYPFDISTLSYGATLPQSTIYINPSGYPGAGLPTSGYFLVTSTVGGQNVSQYIQYTGLVTSGANSPYFTGCTGGTGTLPNSAGLAFVAATTVTAASNGEILGGDNFTVVSTAGFPTTGTIIVSDSNGNETLTYQGITATSFNGCHGGTGTLSTGDPVNLQPTEISSAYIVDTQYSAILTNADGVTNQTYVLIGNTINNDTNQTIESFISSSTLGFNAVGTIPDSNDGYIIWALPNDISVTYKDIINPEGDENNRVQLFISDGNKIRISQNGQTYWAVSEYGVTNGFNTLSISGNLTAYIITHDTESSAFELGNSSGNPFSTVIENDTSYPLTFGYGTSSFLTNNITIPAGEAMFVFGDGTYVYTTPTIPEGISTVLVSAGETYTITEDPSGTTFLINNSSGPCTVFLPSVPTNGFRYTFKDQNNTFSDTQYFTVNGNGYYIGNGNSGSSQFGYTAPNLSFTLQYFSADSIWRVVDKTEDELNPLWGSYYYVYDSDLRQQDFYLDTSYFPIDFYTYDYTTGAVIDGQTFTLKDASQSGAGGNWATNNVTIYTYNTNLEYPQGTINTSGTPIVLNINGLHLKFRFDVLSNTWMLK